MIDKIVAAAGLRNLVVHEYGKIDLTKVYQIAHKDVDDLEEHLRAVFSNCGMAEAIR